MLKGISQKENYCSFLLIKANTKLPGAQNMSDFDYSPLLDFIFFFVIFVNIYLFLRERRGQSMSWGGPERERET